MSISNWRRVFTSSEISVNRELAESVLKELEGEFFEKTASSAVNDKAFRVGVPDQISVEERRESIRNDIKKALSASNLTQRIYFVVRSLIMSIFGGILTLIVFWRLGKIDIIGEVALGVSTYVGSLILSRLLDMRIVNISKNVLAHLGEHTRLRDFIAKNF